VNVRATGTGSGGGGAVEGKAAAVEDLLRVRQSSPEGSRPGRRCVDDDPVFDQAAVALAIDVDDDASPVASPTVDMVTGTCSLPDGRQLSFSEVGDTNGWPVLWCHGGLSSRLDAENALATATTAGVRLITADRPGIAKSDRQRGRTVASWGADIAALADHLGVGRFSVVGWSAGGPHALACAAALGDRVQAVATIGGMAPVRNKADRKELGLKLDRLFIPLCRRAPWLASLLFRASTHQKPEKAKGELLKDLSNADGRVLSPLPSARLSDPYHAAMLHGPHGLIDDYRAVGAPEWGFELATIRAPVRLWQGEADNAVPPSIGRRLAGLVPGAQLELVPDAGHFLVLEHGARVFERLRADAGA
jgi:pimeloyl-ACP methyl ester carboxylesterase